MPDELDWRKTGVVSPLRDQGSCGASWAYATISSIESRWKSITGFMLDLSVQQLIDCVP